MNVTIFNAEDSAKEISSVHASRRELRCMSCSSAQRSSIPTVGMILRICTFWWPFRQHMLALSSFVIAMLLTARVHAVPDVDMATVTSGQNGFRVIGGVGQVGFTEAVAGIGDINGDGIKDIAVGEPAAHPLGRVSQGR